MDYLTFSAMRMRKHSLFCTSSHHNEPYEKQQEVNKVSVLARARAQLLNMLYISTHLSVLHGENVSKTVLYICRNWMNGICLISTH